MIIIDVGANDGQPFICHNRDDTVYAFEPNPRLYDALKCNASDTYHPMNMAVSNFDGTATFNLDDLADAGCSSLKEFSDNISETWPGRQDFRVTSQVLVKVTRLDTFVKKNLISRIDLLHIDAQGCDYEVIESLGDYLDIVQVIECEVANANPLYKNVKSKDELIEYVISKGFVVESISSNDIFDNEQNVRFVNVNSSIST